MTQASHADKNTPTQYAFPLVLLGLLLLVGGVLVDTYFKTGLTTFIGEVLKSIGMALAIGAIFSVMLDSKSWKEYFASRLSEIVIENTYLRKLDAATLTKLQKDILKAQYKNDEIDKEGSFLNFFHDHLHTFISQPYRENVSAELVITDGGGGLLRVFDKTTYICRASSGKVQRSVCWSAGPGEFEKVISLHIRVFKPQDRQPSIDKSYPAAAGATHFTCDEPLGALEHIDCIKVSVESAYLIRPNRFQYWQMAHPTRGFDVAITYPPNCTIQHQSFFINQDDQDSTDQTGYFKVKYGGWLLPDNGMAWDLRLR